jgi:LuxR family transcriptional regulator, transcriptional regulator of spore coat protein
MAQRVPALTTRELQILALVALGYSAKEVGRQCGITHRTVQCHLDTMRLKLRAHNTTHMVAIAIASDLLPQGGQELKLVPPVMSPLANRL